MYVRALAWRGRLSLLAASMVAAFLVARLTIFMVDVGRMDLSVVDRPFFRTHSCLSSYTEAARIAAAGGNVFEVRQYADEPRPGDYLPRFIGPLEVDLYQYPPAFLLLPEAARRAGIDFFTVRWVWYAIQLVVLLGTMVLVARWIGGAYGPLVLVLVPLVWIAPPTRLALQIGNFQVTAFPLSVAAMIAFHAGRQAAGGLALGFAAASKIFPGVLGLVLLVERRWSAAAWTIGAAVAITIVAALTVGTAPFVDFVRYQLPRIQSGAAFFWIEDPQTSAINQSIYGLVTKLRVLGLPSTGQRAANLVSSAYAVLLVPLAIVAAHGLRRLGASGADVTLVRLRSVQVWLALLSLASFRSPFVPDAYGLVGTLWLLTLLAAERERHGDRAALAVLGALCCVVLDGGAVPTPIPRWVAGATLALQLLVLAVNGYVAARPARPITPRRVPPVRPFVPAYTAPPT